MDTVRTDSTPVPALQNAAERYEENASGRDAAITKMLTSPIVTGLLSSGQDAPDHDLSACTLSQLARLYETWEALFHHLSDAGNAPCFFDSDRNFTPAGKVLDKEYDRAAGFLSVIADEAAKRIPAAAYDRDERLCVLVRHEMNTNGRPVNRTILAEAVAAWGAR